jgi:putative transposase
VRAEREAGGDRQEGTGRRGQAPSVAPGRLETCRWNNLGVRLRGLASSRGTRVRPRVVGKGRSFLWLELRWEEDELKAGFTLATTCGLERPRQPTMPTRFAAETMNTRQEIYLHLVWATWDRAPLLTPERQIEVFRAMRRKCEDLGCEAIAVGGIEDHVHLLVKTPPRIAPSLLAKEVKGASSYRANTRHGTRADFRWQGGYGVFSVSRHQVAKIQYYVEHQPEHHARGTLVDFLEPVDPEPPAEPEGSSETAGQ